MFERKAPAWFSVAAVLLLAWEGFGVFAFVQQVRLGADAMGSVSTIDREIYASLPVWFNAIYGVATIVGLLGALALISRSKSAERYFAVSLIAILAMFGWFFLNTDAIRLKGVAQVVPFPVVIALIGLAALRLAQLGKVRRWLR